MGDNRLKTNLKGIMLDNPLLPGSGPYTGDLERMCYLAQEQGLGGIVTKTIAPEAAQVQRPCIVGGKGFIMNCELWSEFDSSRWIKEFLPGYRKSCDAPIIASVGYTAEDLEYLIPQIDPYVDGYELNPRYASLNYSEVGEMVRRAGKVSSKPMWVKMNGASFADPVSFAGACFEYGAGVVAATAIGPNMILDLKKRGPKIGTPGGYVWTSGPNIKPYALAMIHMIKQALPEISIIGTGGVADAEDVLEYLLAGADAVEMLSAAMLNGIDTYKKVIKELPYALEKYSFESVEEVKATEMILPKENYKPAHPVIDEEKCRKCGLCAINCPYFAISADDKDIPHVNEAKCFGCGLCQSRCPVGAISKVL